MADAQLPDCNQEVFNNGVSVGLFDIPKETAEAICLGISAATGARVDWHYIAGRVHIKALPAAPSPPVAAPPATPADVLAKAALYERLQPYLCKTCGGFGMVGGLVSYGDGNAGYESDPCPECAQPDFTDAYQGAREDLLMWKRRAQTAEQKLRDEQRTTSRLVAELNAANGPMRMGEPAAAQPQPQPAQPLTDIQIKAAVHGAVKSGRLSWMGYEKDEAGEYTVPVLSPCHYQLARAIEAALTAPSTPTPEATP